ncbi:MAG: helicase C-terminal domain-containing protein [Candidatus Margulisbacteria bacterium]|nr:helicase C-terminal domain-containing protein [Candidatus Margulisiibacteriota bacterium]
MKVLDFTALDVETTGLSIADNELIEIGLVKYKDGQIIKQYSQFIRPSQKISSYVVKMTGITNDMVAKSPLFSEVAADVLEFIGDDYVVGHNISFDLGMLNNALAKCDLPEISNPNMDTLDLAALLMPTHRSYKLSHLAKVFDIAEDNIHRAKDDALMTGNLYLKMIEKVKELDMDVLKFIYYYVSSGSWFFKDVLKGLFGLKLKYEEYPWILLLNKSMEEEDRQLSGSKRENSTSIEDFSLKDMFSFFKKDGLLGQKMKNYELRTSQMDMLEKVWNALEKNEHHVIEAGTGIGKSFAYLIPSIFFTLKKHEPVVISTKTKNLQEQLTDKDIPFLKKALEVDFSFTMIKGRENYICVNKLAYLFSKVLESGNTDDIKGLMSIMLWLFHSGSGDFSEVHNSLSIRYKHYIYSDSYSCLQTKCPFKTTCFLNRLRKKARHSDLIIVNHSLLFADIYYGGSVLPDFKYLIMDEAHTIEDAATNCFSRGLSKRRIHDIAVKVAEQRIWESNAEEDKAVKDILKGMQKDGRFLIDNNNKTFDAIEKFFRRKEKDNYFFKKSQKRLSFAYFSQEEKEDIENRLQKIETILTGIKEKMEDINQFIKQHAGKIQYGFYKKLLLEIYYMLEDLSAIRQEKENSIRWLEKIELKRNSYYELKVVPVDIGPYLQEHVFKSRDSVIFTSATLAVKSNFNYYLSRIGYLDSEIKIVTSSLSSPFDLENNVLLCVPKDAPEYEDSKEYLQALANYLKSILLTTKGKALVLFTSHKHLSDVYYNIKDELIDNNIQVFCQGKKVADRHLVKAFKEDETSVLMGTDSFWEGIDVPGRALSHVIIVKLPFEVPTDPIVRARMEQVAAKGKSSFFEYVIPTAIVKFKQGVGRLIRSKSDRGSVIILDKRVLTQGYGRSFLQSVIADKKYPADLNELNSLLKSWI